jgi:hypothetical protein
MRVSQAREDLFAIDPVSTERQIFVQLTANPLKDDVNYLAVPWAPIINRKEIVGIALPRLDGGFAVCQHVKYRTIMPLLADAGIDTLFTPHASKADEFGNIRIRAIPHASINGVEPAAEKDLLYSFIGFDSTTPIGNALRSTLLSMSHLEQSVVLRREHWHWADIPGGHLSRSNRVLKEAAEYKNVLARSRFSICPRGHGHGTIRFWESLQAKAIPVLLADDWLLPSGFDWEQCVIMLPEKQVREVPEVIRSVTPEREGAMRAACGRAFALNSGLNLTRTIRSDQTLRIYTMVTPSHRQLFERWFLPTLSERCEVRVQECQQFCPSGEFKTEGWLRTMKAKVDGILIAIEENWDGIFLFADADVQFFGPVGPMVRASLARYDSVYQQDSPSGTLCAGFFSARANHRIKKLWSEIKERLDIALQTGAGDTNVNDQSALNKIIPVALHRRIWKSSDIRWDRFSPEDAYSAGALTGRKWEVGDAVAAPAGIKVHHANWTAGIENKVFLLRAVRRHVTGSAAPPAAVRDDVEVFRVAGSSGLPRMTASGHKD